MTLTMPHAQEKDANHQEILDKLKTEHQLELDRARQARHLSQTL